MRRATLTGQRLAVFVIFYIAFVLLLISFQAELRSNENHFAYFYDKKSSSNSADQQKNRQIEIVGENFTYIFNLSNITANDSELVASKKIIFFWNTNEFSQKHLGGCPDWNCRIETDKSLINLSHAVIFYGSYAGYFPPVRYPWQYYVFFTQESPLHSYANEPYANFYNLSLNYRRDADAPCPYGYSVKRLHPLSESSAFWRNIRHGVARKQKLAAWFVSNCGAPSNRDKLVSEMKKYMQIDVYGSCGDLKCPLGNKHCSTMLNEKYKFYFAFENSICRDYATEKFWEKMTMNVLVVVLKRSVVENYVPPKSFIAVDDFKSPKALVDYLLMLNTNNELYLDYFKWKLNYEAVFLNGNAHDVKERPWGFCRLCQILNEGKPINKSYENIQDWWVAQGHCDNGLVDRLMIE